MTFVPQTFSPAFHESVELLRQLHGEMANGNADGERADDIRDAMERPWYALTETERKFIRVLSADLYTLGHPWSAEQSIPSDVAEAIVTALRHEHWEELFDILQQHERVIPPDGVAYFRGLAWFRLGHPLVALEFFEEAVHVSANQLPAYMHCWLTVLGALDRMDVAMPQAERIAADSDDPLLLLDAAQIFFVRSTEVSGSDVDQMIQRAVETAERGLELTTQGALDEVLASQAATIYSWLALNQARLGDMVAAFHTIGIARNLSPNQPGILFVEEILKQRSSPSAWEQGVGRGLGKLPQFPTDVSRFAPDVFAVHS